MLKAAKKTKISQPLKVKRVKRAANIGTIHVALIARKDTVPTASSFRLSSLRDDSGWYALMSHDREKLIEDALKQAGKFGASKYEVWLGTLSEKVVIPTNFKVVKL